MVLLKYPGHNFVDNIDQQKWCTKNLGPEAAWRDSLTEEKPWTLTYERGDTHWYFFKEEDAVLFALRWSR